LLSFLFGFIKSFKPGSIQAGFVWQVIRWEFCSCNARLTISPAVLTLSFLDGPGFMDGYVLLA